MSIFKRWVLLFLLFVTSIGCKSEYRKMVDNELAKGVRHDSLFLGISFGMTQKDFYGHCWELNKQGIIWQGSENATVQYKLTDLNHKATMDFYPKFHNNQIYEMPVIFAYGGWSPWNKHLSADSLQLDVINMFEKWYGDGFIKVEHPNRGAAFVKVDGNRRITIMKQDDMKVRALFSDLLTLNELKEEELGQLPE